MIVRKGKRTRPKQKPKKNKTPVKPHRGNGGAAPLASGEEPLCVSRSCGWLAGWLAGCPACHASHASHASLGFLVCAQWLHASVKEILPSLSITTVPVYPLCYMCLNHWTLSSHTQTPGPRTCLSVSVCRYTLLVRHLAVAPARPF